MQRARLARDADYDGIFWVGVRTTGIYCRPSCPARPPREENVVYLFRPEAAVAQGLRACLRCRPAEIEGAEPDWVGKLLAWSASRPGPRPRDADLVAAGFDPVRVRRWFRRRHGTTFHAYHRSRRLGDALLELRGGSTVLDVAMAQGYSSGSGFQDAFGKVFGTTPGRADTVCRWVRSRVESPLGPLELAASDAGLCLLEFSDRRALPGELARLEARFGSPPVAGEHPVLAAAATQLSEYFAGARRDFDLPLDLAGTAFQRKVWDELLRIPYGTTLSYGELATRVGSPGGARAVGSANGANCVAIVVPCHRVVQADGTLRGYGGGLWRKQLLLELEQSGR